jgi:lipid II:glycine glycyltransferase (peptidoglycan interpeptide bridge formation enzyme)
MIEIFRNKAGLHLRELYFAPGITESTAKRDIDVYVQSKSPIRDRNPFWTLLADLSQDEDVLFSKLATSHRQKVRRASDKDGLVVEATFSPTNEDIDSFVTFYDEFAKFRGIEMANTPKLKIFNKTGNFCIFSVRAETDNVPLAMLSMITDDVRGRQYIGGTSPRTLHDNAILGRANVLLIWKSIMLMKESGRKIYDFGGISHSKELEGVDNFKRMFGGHEIQEHNALIGISWKGRIALKAANLLGFFPNPAS